MAWATVVKIIDRLTEAGIVEQVGTAKRPSLPGKHAVLYNLTDAYPLAIGIDVEYHTTTITVSSFGRRTLAEMTRPTPSPINSETLKPFLTRLISRFLDDSPRISRENILGIGIGVPSIGLPPWNRSTSEETQESIGRYVEEEVGIPVRIHDNTLSYSVYERWTNQAFSADDFIFVSIRTGVGCGIFANGQLLEGHQGLAGMLGHIVTEPEGPDCRCGRRGCLETVSNQYYLFERYQTEVLGMPPTAVEPAVSDVHSALQSLFTKAKHGNRAAMAVVQDLAQNLSRALAPAIMVLNPPTVIISAYFGPDGEILLPLLREELSRRVLRRMDYSLKYWEFDPPGHTLGAALLFFADFLTPVLNPIVPPDGAER
ncbi:ROK family protein [Salinispira pacifica]